MSDPIPLRAKLTHISHHFGSLAAVAAGISMLMHVVAPPQVQVFLPHFMAAFAIVLCAGALSFLQRRPRISQALTLAALALALGTVVLFYWWGIPQKPLQQHWMMAPVANFVVFILASAIWCLHHVRTLVLAQILAVVGLTVCLLALIGYLQGTIALADIGTAFPMTTPAAALLVMISLSILCARPEVGPMGIVTSATSAGTVARRVMIPLILLPIALNFIIHNVAGSAWYAPGLGNGLFTFATMLTIAALVWWQVLTLYRSEALRKQIEERARLAELQYTLLVQAVTDYAIFTLDPEGRISSWNTGAQRIRGYTAEEVLGHPFGELFQPDGGEGGILQRLLEITKSKGRVEYEGWQKRKDGSLFFANSIFTRMDDAHGRLLGFAKVTRDITAQKQAEAEQVKLQSILNTAVDPILVIDSSGIIETFNPAAERAFGYRAAEVLQRNISLLMPSPDREQHDEYLRRYRDTREAHVIGIGRKIKAQRKGGSVFPADLSVSEMWVNGLQKFTGIVRDTTARTAAEDALKRSESRLKRALEGGNVAVWELDMKTQAVMPTGSLFEKLGVPEGSAVEFSDWISFNHPDDQAVMLEQFAQIARGQRNLFEMEHRMRTKHDAWHWLLSRGTASRHDNDGQALRMHGTTSDIHHCKTMEMALRQSRLDLDIALKGAAFHLWHFHVEEQRLAGLDALIEALGYEHTPNTRKPSLWLSLLHPEDLAYWRTKSLLPLPDELGKKGIELRLRARDGSWHWLMTRAQVVKTNSHDAPLLIAGSCIDISPGKRAAEQLLHAAQHDELTGLPNRALGYAFGERLLEAAHRHGHQCAVLFVDLDRFKPINDIYGHGAGDAVLREIGQRLQRCVRGEDVVGRLGGDEFLLILAQVQKVEDITHVATNCLIAVSRPIVHLDLELQVSSSIGISLYPEDGGNMDTLLKHADTAMYHAKQNGHNNFQFFTPAMNARAESLLKLEGRLRQAIAQEAFCLYFQPVVDTITHRLVGAEALLRWPAENIGPDEFIPLAESSGMILPLGDWALREACRQQKCWMEKGVTPFRISVNISPRQFRQQQFHGRVANIIAETRINPAHLQLEITENAFLMDLNEVVHTLSALRETGLSIALDDFGKDYSSLNYLKSLPLDAVKVDKDFVHDLQTDKVNLAITEAIIHLGDSLGLEVIAEGVENEAVLQLLRARHCRHMQGFFLSQPLPAAEFEAWFRDPLAPGRAYQH